MGRRSGSSLVKQPRFSKTVSKGADVVAGQGWAVVYGGRPDQSWYVETAGKEGREKGVCTACGLELDWTGGPLTKFPVSEIGNGGNTWPDLNPIPAV